MKNIYIPTRCPKCENDVLFEALENETVKVYCGHCDFILPIDKDELEYVNEYFLIER